MSFLTSVWNKIHFPSNVPTAIVFPPWQKLIAVMKLLLFDLAISLQSTTFFSEIFHNLSFPSKHAEMKYLSSFGWKLIQLTMEEWWNVHRLSLLYICQRRHVLSEEADKTNKLFYKKRFFFFIWLLFIK